MATCLRSTTAICWFTSQILTLGLLETAAQAPAKPQHESARELTGPMHCLTARLQRADEHASDKGDILLQAQLPAPPPAAGGSCTAAASDDAAEGGSCPAKPLGPLQWGLWVNVARNPRARTVDYSDLGVVAEVPKSVALASIALRVQVRCVAERWAWRGRQGSVGHLEWARERWRGVGGGGGTGHQ